MTEVNVEQAVSAYVRLRDLIAQRDKAHKDAQKPLKDQLEQLENLLQKRMQDQGVKSLRTGAGTAYIQEIQKPVVEDRARAQQFIEEGQRFDLLEFRIAKTPLLESGEQVPGVTIQTIVKTNVRRS